MDLHFELEKIGNTLFEKGDFDYEINLGTGRYYNVLANKQPYLQVRQTRKGSLKLLLYTIIIFW